MTTLTRSAALFALGLGVLVAPSCARDGDGSAPEVDGGLDGSGVPGIEVTPTTELRTGEDGSEATFRVVLRTRPSLPVIVPIASQNEGEVRAAPSVLRFTPEDWDQPKLVTLTGQNDDEIDGDRRVSIAVGPATSADVSYEGATVPAVMVVNVDDDTPGLVVTKPEPTNETTEQGDTISFTVRLRTRPYALVTVPVASTKPAEGTADPKELVFTSGTWNLPQPVTVTGKPDGLKDGDQSYFVALGASKSGDTRYSGLQATVAVKNLDYDPPCPFGTVTYADISAGRPAESGYSPFATIDATSGKLLVVTNDHNGPDGPTLFRCNLDGTNCTFSQVWVAPCTQCGSTPFVVLDTANAKMNVVTRNYTTGNRAALWRCNLDGTGCIYRDINAGEDINSGHWPSALIDKQNAKLVVVAENYAHDGPSVYRCNLDGLGCTHHAIPVDAYSNRDHPKVMVHPSGMRLLIVTSSLANKRRLSLFDCKIDGMECTTTDISAGQGEYATDFPSAAIDIANGKLLVATDNDGTDGQLSLYRCNLDGTSCTRTQVTAPGSWREPSLVIDLAKGKILIAAQSRGTSGLALHRCNLDGSACTFAEISAGHASLLSPSTVLDVLNRRLLVAVNDHVARKPALLRVCVD